MLEETASAIPSSLWASMNSWFTPTVLFLLLNLMIATILFTSTSSNPKQQQQTHSNNLARSPSSLLHRLKSINLYASQHKQTPDSTVAHHLDASQVEAAHFFFPPHTSEETVDTAHQSQSHFVYEQSLPQTQTQTHFDFEVRNSSLDEFEKVGDEEDRDDDEEKSMDEVYSQLTGTHFNRTKSDTKPTSGEIPPKLPAKMRKSASVKSAFAHFEEEEIVEARRPATVRERGNNAKATQADEGVDAKADDFINRFKQQLKLQRLDSFIRYKDMIGRRR